MILVWQFGKSKKFCKVLLTTNLLLHCSLLAVWQLCAANLLSKMILYFNSHTVNMQSFNDKYHILTLVSKIGVAAIWNWPSLKAGVQACN